MNKLNTETNILANLFSHANFIMGVYFIFGYSSLWKDAYPGVSIFESGLISHS